MSEVLEHSEHCCPVEAQKIDEIHRAITDISATLGKIDLSNINPMDIIKGLMSKK